MSWRGAMSWRGGRPGGAGRDAELGEQASQFLAFGLAHPAQFGHVDHYFIVRQAAAGQLNQGWIWSRPALCARPGPPLSGRA
jgi:hypothetical protein